MLNFFKKTNTTKKNLKKGFSLIELIVVVGIITLITSVVLVNHSAFSGTAVLENLAYETALTIRQAQFFGINVRSFDVGGSASFDIGYGVYFDMDNPTQIILFADANNNNMYDGTSELVEVYNITNNNRVVGMCVDNGCDGGLGVNKVHITFKRPDPDAVIKTDSIADCGSELGVGCGLTKVYLGSDNPTVARKIVTVSSTGQISIGTQQTTQ